MTEQDKTVRDDGTVVDPARDDDAPGQQPGKEPVGDASRIPDIDQSPTGEAIERTGDQPEPASEPTPGTDADAQAMIQQIMAGPVTELDEKAQRIFGDDFRQIEAVCEAHGIDYAAHVHATADKLTELEAEQAALLESFKANLPEQLWPPVNHAIGINHAIENCRRGLLMLMNTGHLHGPLAEHITAMVGALSQNVNGFVNAVITQLVGHDLAGFDQPTVVEKILTPFNAVMAKKLEIFDMMSAANGGLTERLNAARQKQAEAQLGGKPAANEDSTPKPSIH